MAGGRDVCTLKCREGHSFHEEAETTFVCGPDTKGTWNGLNLVKLPKCSSKLSVYFILFIYFATPQTVSSYYRKTP